MTHGKTQCSWARTFWKKEPVSQLSVPVYILIEKCYHVKYQYLEKNRQTHNKKIMNWEGLG